MVSLRRDAGASALAPTLERWSQNEIHPRALPTLRARLKRASQAHALATQTGHDRTGFKRRELVLRWRPATAAASSFLAPSAGVTS